MSHILTRLDAVLPADLAHERGPTFGSRKKSPCMAQTLEGSLARLKKQMLIKELEEGYSAAREQGLALCKDFGDVDLEGWGERY